MPDNRDLGDENDSSIPCPPEKPLEMLKEELNILEFEHTALIVKINKLIEDLFKIHDEDIQGDIGYRIFELMSQKNEIYIGIQETKKKLNIK